MRHRGFLVAAIAGVALAAGSPAQADPVEPTPVIDMSVCDAGPVLCPIFGALLGVTEVLVGSTLGFITYGLCLGPVGPGPGAILPPIIYDFRPWCPPQPAA